MPAARSSTSTAASRFRSCKCSPKGLRCFFLFAWGPTFFNRGGAPPPPRVLPRHHPRQSPRRRRPPPPSLGPLRHLDQQAATVPGSGSRRVGAAPRRGGPRVGPLPSPLVLAPGEPVSPRSVP